MGRWGGGAVGRWVGGVPNVRCAPYEQLGLFSDIPQSVEILNELGRLARDQVIWLDMRPAIEHDHVVTGRLGEG